MNETTIEIVKKSENDKVIAFAGNPNVGKSTLFNVLTGMHQHTGNWPGKTVELAQGYATSKKNSYVFVDLPGTYSLMAHSPEEEVARDFIISEEASATVVVCDATALERNLNLVLQIMILTPRVVVCVNLLDEAQRKKINIDIEELEQKLGVPVVATSATHEKGIDELLEKIDIVTQTDYVAGRQMLEKLDKITKEPDEKRRIELIIGRAAATAFQVTTYDNENFDARDRKLDKLFTSRLTGIPIMILLLFLVFWLTIEGANVPSEMLAKVLFSFQDVLNDIATWMHWPAWLQGALIDGVYKVVAWVISVMLPPMAIFFPLFTLLEDFGYLPRVAFNLDNAFQKSGACGKQALSMCMGFGCNAAGVTGARIIDSPRERLIAIITNNFVPCNGRFPILITIITLFFVGNKNYIGNSLVAALILTGTILLGVMMTMLMSKILSKTILSGMPSSFTLELPPYRKPRIGQVLVRSILDRTIFVLGRAIKVSAPVGLLIWILANVTIGNMTLLAHITTFLDPLAALMGLDGVILMAFILGLPANEIVIPCMLMGYLATSSIVDYDSLGQLKVLLIDNGWTLLTAINVMLFTLFHWPCGTTLLTIKKETGSRKWTWVSFWVPTLIGVICTLTTTAIWKLLGL